MATALHVLAIVAALLGLGLGPLARLLPGRSTLEYALCAPAAGLLVATVASTFALLAGVPVAGWVRPGLVAGALASLWLWRGRAAPGRRPTPSAAVWALSGALVTGALLVGPSLAGGREFELLRGNGTDAFNYASIAQLLGERGLPAGPLATPDELLAQGRYVPLADDLVRRSRWSTCALLAWTGRLVGRPPVEVGSAFSLACVLALYGPTWTLLATLGAGRRAAALVAAGLSAGAWSGFVVDLSAQSHLSSVPASGLLLVAATDTGRGAWLVAGAALGGVLLLYPELLPMLGLGAALAAGLALRDGWRPRATELGWGLLGATSVAGPLAPFLLSFLSKRPGQLPDHSPFTPTFRRVLLDDPLLGASGLWPLADRGAAPAWTNGLLALLAVGLLAVTSASLVRALRAGGPRLPAGVTVAGALQAAALAGLGQLWAFGKAVTFAAPFVALTLATPGRRGRFARLAGAAAIAWAALQLLVGADRIRAAATFREPPRSLPHHVQYRLVDPDVAPIVEAARRAARPVTVLTGDVWCAELLALTAGADLASTAADPVRGVPWEVVERARRSTRPTDLLVVPRRTASPELLTRALAVTRGLALVPAEAGLAWAPEGLSWIRRPRSPPHSLVLHAWSPRPCRVDLRLEPLDAPTRVLVRGLEGASAAAAIEAGRQPAAARFDLPAGFSQLEVLPAAPIDLDCVSLVERPD